jgi:hypothetical protein
VLLAQNTLLIMQISDELAFTKLVQIKDMKIGKIEKNAKPLFLVKRYQSNFAFNACGNVGLRLQREK